MEADIEEEDRDCSSTEERFTDSQQFTDRTHKDKLNNSHQRADDYFVQSDYKRLRGRRATCFNVSGLNMNKNKGGIQSNVILTQKSSKSP
jgi:hypothetical protein